MEFTPGTILEGKVKSITKFGAFIALPEGKSGLVHISEIAYTYVNEVRDFLTEGQDVKVQILEVDQAGRLNLSIKRAQPKPQTQSRAPVRQAARPAPRKETAVPMGEVLPPSDDRAFEDKLKAFTQVSEEIRCELRRGSERRGASRGGRSRK